MCDWAKSRDDIYGEHTTVVYGEGRVRAGWGTSRPAQGKPPAEVESIVPSAPPLSDTMSPKEESAVRSTSTVQVLYCSTGRGSRGALHGHSYYSGRVSGEPACFVQDAAWSQDTYCVLGGL